MATQTAPVDEENLIILDDVPEESNISNEIKVEEPTASEDIIDFGGENTSISSDNDISFDLGSTNNEEVSIENQTEIDNKDLDNKESDSDISLDLGDLGNTSTITEEESIKEESIIDEPVLEQANNSEDSSISDDFSFGSELSSGDDSSSGDNSSDLNSILDETIVKLQSRADVISEDKISELDNIKEYKRQIKELESSVSTSEAIVSDLNKEATKIKSNIRSLERMKMKDEIAETKKETSKKVHNTKRSR